MWPTSPLRRNRYFSGKILGVKDFADEQEYGRERLRRHNRCLHGFGVACGLGVTCDGDGVHVGAGLAIDGYGEEIVVPVETALAPPAAGRVAYLVLRYAECETEPLRVPDEMGMQGVEHTRIEEGYALVYEARDPRRVPCEGPALGVPIARLTLARSRWRVDRKFRPPRAR